jgi:proliferating cell nuclear antigen
MASIIELTTKTKLFSSLIQQLSGFTATIRISVYPEVCVIDAINESRTSLTKLNLSKEWFDTYVSLTTLTLIVNTNILYKILNALDTDSLIKLSLSTSDLVIEGKSIHSDVTYSIPSLIIEFPTLDIPEDMEYSADISMNSKTFCSILEHLLIIGDDCSLTINEDSMVFTTVGDYGSTKVDLTIDDLNSYAVEENIDLQLDFQLKILHLVSLFYKSSEILDMHVDKDKPLVIQYNMEHESYIRFMIAPKIKDE